MDWERQQNINKPTGDLCRELGDGRRAKSFNSGGFYCEGVGGAWVEVGEDVTCLIGWLKHLATLIGQVKLCVEGTQSFVGDLWRSIPLKSWQIISNNLHQNIEWYLLRIFGWGRTSAAAPSSWDWSAARSCFPEWNLLGRPQELKRHRRNCWNPISSRYT